MYASSLATPIGTLRLIADDQALHRIILAGATTSGPLTTTAPKEHALLHTVTTQLLEYFNGNRQIFELPLSVEGTSFQRAVWKEILQIPYGEKRTYKEIAARLGSAAKARAVGGAANKNPLPLVIPCHRVIGSNGALTGFAGGVKLKAFLLDLEGKIHRGT